MEERLKIVFEITKLSKLKNENQSNWLDFIADFISNSNQMAEFFFLIDYQESISNPNFAIEFKKNKTKIVNYLKKTKKINFKLPIFHFGTYKNPENVDDDIKINFYDIKKNASPVELLNNEALFFFDEIEFGSYLFFNKFFAYFLNFQILKNEKPLKRISKQANGVVDDTNFESINFSTLNYEFLTFIEDMES